jgi:hypothetical protein
VLNTYHFGAAEGAQGRSWEARKSKSTSCLLQDRLSSVKKAILDFRLGFIWSESKIIGVMPLTLVMDKNKRSS